MLPNDWNQSPLNTGGRASFTNNMSPIDAENNRRRALSMGSPTSVSPLNLASLQQGTRDLSLPEDNFAGSSPAIVLGPVTTHKAMPADLKVHLSPRFPLRNRSNNNSSTSNYVTSSPSSTSFDYSSDTNTDDVIFGTGASLSSKQLRTLFPYHIVVNQDFNVIQMGSQLSTLLRKKTNISRGLTYEHIGKYFRIVQPHSYPWDWKALSTLRDVAIELELSKDFMPSTATGYNGAPSPSRSSQMLQVSNNSDSGSGRSSPSPANSFTYSFIGSVQVMHPRDDNELLSTQAVFILHPNVKDTTALRKWDLKANDLSAHSFQRELMESTEKLNMASDEISKLKDEKLKLQEEIAKLKMESNATEMRHMIANVAHDLKTPLAAFLGAVELVDMTLQTVKPAINRIVEKANTSAYRDEMNSIYENVESAQGNLKNMRDINNFMTMTINRCIDYTKASQGLKLVPKFETIDLAEVLLLPMNCMQAMQSKMKIDLLPISDEICTHIMTDKQWLQENLLCLLSNAVKYSHEGSIVINIYLHPGTGEDRSPISLTMKQGQIISYQQQVRPQHRQSFGVTSSSSKYGGATPSSRVRSDSEGEDGVTTGRNSFSYPSSPISAASPHPHQNAESRSERSMPESGVGPASIGFNTLQPRHSMSKNSFAEKLLAKGLTMLDTCVESPSQPTRNMSMPPLLMIEVEDTGIGLTEDAMDNLFNPFQQAQRLAGGTGLGLYSLAKRLDALNGFYGVDKRRDSKSGSMFWFAFPYRPDAELARTKPVRHLSKLNIDWIEKERERFMEQAEQEQADAAVKLSPKFDGGIANTGSSNSDRSLQILLVDDSSPILKMTSAVLRRQGHKVEQAENGAEAVKKVTARMNSSGLPYDCILMDLIMPVMDGLEATRRIREMEINSNNAVFRNTIICVSANSDDDTIESILEAGANEFMCKPFSLQNFYEAYQRSCGFETAL